MDAIRKQASKLREQVAKQQQAILRQLGQISNEPLMTDEFELECHQQLQKLYNSTKTAKHFQRHIVRGTEGLISISSKQMEIVRKLAKDCCKYGTENQGSSYPLARASLQFGNSYDILENERETILGILGNQISEPLRAQITGAPLEDARHLTHRYDKLRQEVEAQAAEVLRRRSKLRDSSISAESTMRLQNAETRFKELKSALVALGREATAAMLSVEEQQQQITLQSLSTMVDAERAYHQHALVILDKLYAEMIMERQPKESTSFPLPRDGYNKPADENTKSNGFDYKHNSQTGTYFFAKVIHPFDAQAEGELSLSVDDYVVVRQVDPNGWSEGECNGNAGWFPSAYVQRQDLIPANKIME
ncbi:SH3 domain-containing protein 1 [Gastrolobium bilobum]|uniref:SH3 domain-containing protein 1 n=1 Tax=Gastrolobium bilobum TaxID=150636 RepID=UPI002AB27165|nr:SH3 domain-containing protein 1 [Gastrolobium bilobum]XP_061359877.1 SH3 domain-containing protein 1 [Gastrolobium bilobum]XP_061359878.1 SH3 domain-containing protein 1 [Gastrolobium bilobum]XP_061359879.1 SH3 domain-containing protein 1 [Gastrolobium bilobum]